jgi:hypothetical protein
VGILPPICCYSVTVLQVSSNLFSYRQAIEALLFLRRDRPEVRRPHKALLLLAASSLDCHRLWLHSFNGETQTFRELQNERCA